MVEELIRWPDVAGIWAGFTVSAPVGEIGIVESLVPVGDRTEPGLVVRGGVAGVRRLAVPARDVLEVDSEGREIRLRATPAGADSWPLMRASAGISPGQWRRFARAAMADARRRRSGGEQP